MSKITHDLFLTVSNLVNVRVTPDNLREKMKSVSSMGGVNSELKTNILIELLLSVAKLEEKIDKNG